MRAAIDRRIPGHLRPAYAACLRLARHHYENFPVASVLVPRGLRPHVAAVYAYARTADDFADEGARPPDERLALLDEWARRAREAATTGRASTADVHSPIFDALGHTIRSHALPVSLFEDLVSAFAQDVVVTRYETWADVLDYCRRSANPVGRLVLRLAGYADAERDRRSDALCTALQLANFWQDFGIDWSRGRLYVPAEVWRACGADTATLGVPASPLDGRWRAALERCALKTRELFVEGRGIADLVGGRLALELRLTWLGGMRILEQLAAHSFDPVARRPKLGAADVAAIAARMLTWRRGAQAGRCSSS